MQVPHFARLLLQQWLGARALLQRSRVSIQLPSVSAAPSGLSASDLRDKARHPCQLGVELYRLGKNVPHRCHLTDVSTGGCYVETPEPFPKGTQVEMIVRTEDFKFRSAGVVKVMHPGFGMGVEFDAQNSAQKDQVQRLIKIVFRNKQEMETSRF